MCPVEAALLVLGGIDVVDVVDVFRRREEVVPKGCRVNDDSVAFAVCPAEAVMGCPDAFEEVELAQLD